MKFGYSRGKTTRFVWGLLLLGSVTSMATTLALGLAGNAPADVQVPQTPAAQVMVLAGLAAFATLFGAPFFTTHELRSHHLVIRQGLHFWAAISYEEISAVERTERSPIGLGVRWYPGELYVLTWPADLVAIRLRRPTRFRLFWVLPLPKVSTVVVNVDQPDALVAALRSRLSRTCHNDSLCEPITSRRTQ